MLLTLFHSMLQTDWDGDVVSLASSASDTSGTPSYSATGLPTGLSIDSGTGVVSGTIGSSADVNSPYTTTITAGHGTYSNSQTFTWVVNATPVSQIGLVNPGNQTNYDAATEKELAG